MSGATQAANNFLAAAGITGPTQSKAITQLVADLYSSGLWSKMKAVYPMVTDNYNLLSYTEDFSNAAWSKGGGTTVTANSTTAPNGTMTADTIVLPNTGTISQSLVSSSHNAHTLSIYLKASTNTTIKLGFLSPGSVVVCNVTTEWQRFTYTYSFAGTTYPQLYNDTGSTVTLYAWGAQAELGSSATTYQPILTTPSAFMASQMKYNLKDARDLDAAFRLTWSGGWTYSATGATPNGTNAYADTKFNLSTNFGTREQSYSLYTQASNSNANVLAGVTDGSSPTQFYNGTGQFNILSTLYAKGSSFSNGYILMTSTLNAISAFEKVVKLGSTSGTTYSSVNYNYYIGARNNAGTADFFADRKYSFAHIGNSLTDQEALVLSQIVEKYQVALSRGVQAAQSFYYNSAYSNEANTYLYSTQITGTTQVSAINTLINGLKANNLWSKMKAVYPFVTDYRNILGFTEDFGDVYWTKGGAIIVTNSIISPNGTLTADSLVEDTANSNHLVGNNSAISTSANNYTLSVYAKKANRDWIYLNLYNGTTSLFAWFNLNTGIVGTVQSGLTASIQDAGSGWYRLSVTRTLPSTSNCFIQYGSASADNIINFVGNGLVAAYIWGAQLESGAQATPYQPVLAANSSSTFMSSQMKFNLVNPQDSDAAFRLAFSGGWTYSTNGAQPNGTNGYADTKLNPSVSLSTSSAHLSFYSRTNSPSSGYTGYELAIGHYSLITQFQGSTFYSNLEGAGAYNGSYTSTNGLGHFIASRINNTTTQGFKNGSKVINVTQNSTLVNGNLLISSRGGGNYSNKQTAFATIGDGLTDAEAALLYQIIQQYETDLSRQV